MKQLRSIASKLRGRPEEKERSEALRGLTLLGGVISLLALGVFTGDLPRVTLLLAATAGGHLFSRRREGRVTWLGELLMYIAFAAALIPVRGELLAIFTGGSLLPLARFLATGMAISSWGLRTRRNLYNNIELSLVALLLVGEGALSLTFLGYLFVFALVVLTFLAMSHLPVATATPRVALPGRRAILRMGTAVTTAILVLGVAVYLALPQNHTVSSAGPLPSRLDLTSGWPATPTDLTTLRMPSPSQTDLSNTRPFA